MRNGAYTRMNIRIVAIVFFGFILWAIYQANTGAESQFAQLVRSIPYGDKVGHFGLFGLLTLLANSSFNYSKIQLGRCSVLVGTVLVLGFVTIEEASQGLLPTRTMDAYDLIADFLGIAMFTLISLKFARRANFRASDRSVAR